VDDLGLTSKWLDLLLIALLNCDSEQSNLPTLFQTPSVVNRPIDYSSMRMLWLEEVPVVVRQHNACYPKLPLVPSPSLAYHRLTVSHISPQRRLLMAKLSITDASRSAGLCPVAPRPHRHSTEAGRLFLTTCQGLHDAPGSGYLPAASKRYISGLEVVLWRSSLSFYKDELS
jgi:hypothetical protein